MAGFNRNRSLENAKKHLEKGQLDRALKELQKVLEDQPDDAATRVQMAGILAKKGDKAGALEHYEKVAEHYSKGRDFDRRAIATYEHMLKIDGTRFDLRLKLARLLEALGRPSEAVREMHIAVEQLEKDGKDKELEAVLLHMIQLDPSDLSARKKLASLTERKGAVPDAKHELKALAEHYRAAGDAREHLALMERIYAMDPEDPVVACDVARLYLEKQKAKIALLRLQSAFNAAPQDTRVLEMLVRAFSALERPDKAREVARALAKARGLGDVTLPPVPAPTKR